MSTGMTCLVYTSYNDDHVSVNLPFLSHCRYCYGYSNMRLFRDSVLELSQVSLIHVFC